MSTYARCCHSVRHKRHVFLDVAHRTRRGASKTRPRSPPQPRPATNTKFQKAPLSRHQTPRRASPSRPHLNPQFSFREFRNQSAGTLCLSASVAIRRLRRKTYRERRPRGTTPNERKACSSSARACSYTATIAPITRRNSSSHTRKTFFTTMRASYRTPPLRAASFHQSCRKRTFPVTVNLAYQSSAPLSCGSFVAPAFCRLF